MEQQNLKNSFGLSNIPPQFEDVESPEKVQENANEIIISPVSNDTPFENIDNKLAILKNQSVLIPSSRNNEATNMFKSPESAQKRRTPNRLSVSQDPRQTPAEIVSEMSGTHTLRALSRDYNAMAIQSSLKSPRQTGTASKYFMAKGINSSQKNASNYKDFTKQIFVQKS